MKAAVRTPNLLFLKAKTLAPQCQVVIFLWSGSPALDVHLELRVFTIGWLAIMVVDMVVGFILSVLSEDILAGHPGDDRQVGRGSLGYGGVTPIQQELTIVDNSSSSRRC